MARRTVQLTIPADAVSGDTPGETIDGEIETDAERDAQRAERDASDDILSTLTKLDTAGEARWQVVRTMPSENEGYVCHLTTAELSLETIKKRCGPGTYRVTGFNAKGQYIKRQTVTIAKEADSGPGTSLVPVANQGVSDWMAFFERQKMQQKEEVKFWLGLLLPVLPMILNLFQRRESGIGEMVTALKGLKGMTDGDNPLDQLSKTKQLIELVKSMTPEGKDTGSTWPDIIRDLAGGVTQALPNIASVLATRRAQPAQPAGVMAGIPPENIVTPQAPQTATPQNEGDPMLALMGWLNAQLPGLIVRAQRNSDPDAYAYVMLDNLPAGADPVQLYQFIQRPDWWDFLKSVNPGVAPHEAWFTEFRRSIMRHIEDASPSLKEARREQRRREKQNQAQPQEPEQTPGGEQ
jgi:hypothetical protein